jgi:hypothetical protein
MPSQIYSPTGRKVSSKMQCPKCRFLASKVVSTNEDESGVTIRKRRCKSCEHVFFTAQEPEYIVKSENIAWKSGRLSLRDNSAPLASLGIPTQPYHALMRAGYKTVNQVAGLSDDQILAIKGVGVKFLLEIRTATRGWKNRSEDFLPQG